MDACIHFFAKMFEGLIRTTCRLGSLKTTTICTPDKATLEWHSTRSRRMNTTARPHPKVATGIKERSRNAARERAEGGPSRTTDVLKRSFRYVSARLVRLFHVFF